MRLTDAAEQWLRARAAEQVAKREKDEAADVLKAHFRKTARTSYRGVGYSSSDYRQLDANLARTLLGDRASEAEVVRTRETLTPLG